MSDAEIESRARIKQITFPQGVRTLEWREDIFLEGSWLLVLSRYCAAWQNSSGSKVLYWFSAMSKPQSENSPGSGDTWGRWLEGIGVQSSEYPV